MGNDDGPLPRVLIVSPHGFNHLTAGGVTFTSLFKGWPRDSLAIVHNDPLPPTNDVCARHYGLSDREIRLAPYLSLFGLLSVGRWTGGAVPGDRDQGPAPDEGGRSGTASSFLVRLRGRFLAILRTLFGGELPHRARLSDELTEWVADFDPQVIYSVLGSTAIMDLVLRLRDRFELPVAVHLMDDWRAAQHRNGLLSFLERFWLLRLFDGLMRSASVRMGICPAMCADYERRYGVEFRPFQNTVEIEEIRRVESRSKDGWFSLAYTGSIRHDAQAESLADVCQAVIRLRARGAPIRVDIYSLAHLSPSDRGLPVADCIRLLEPVPHGKKYFEVLVNADVLLLPVNFDELSRRLVRLSMPTKVPEYLAAGRPILAYGPIDVAQMQYARDGGWGLAVTRRDVSEVEKALERLMTDDALRGTLSEAASSSALDHDASAVRPAFRTAVARSAQWRNT